MSDTHSLPPRIDQRRLRLDTLLTLRWLAIAGQAITVLTVHYGLGYALPIQATVLVIGLGAAVNLVLRHLHGSGERMGDAAATALLGFDIAQLGALLYLTGGLANPFSFLFLAPVMIAATTLPPGRTVLLGALAIAAAGFLALWHQPLPWQEGAQLDFPPLYLAGVWAAIVLGIVFIGVYAWRVSEEAHAFAEGMAAAELALTREQHLSQIDGLAAAAAHQLGTPLSTIALVVNELDRAVPADSPLKEDVQLLKTESARCREILGRVASLGHEPESPLGRMRLAQLLEEVASPQRAFDVQVRTILNGEGQEPTVLRDPAMLYGLGNLVENAVDFATSAVVIAAHWDDRRVTITIRDDGPGIPAETLARFGDPYASGRRGRRPRLPTRGRSGGLGLGVFIAKTLLERTGASLEAANAVPPETGAIVTLRWSRPRFEKGEGAATEPPLLPVRDWIA